MRKILSLLVVTLVSALLLGIVSMRHKPATFEEHSLEGGEKFTPVDCWFDTGADTHVQCGWLSTMPANSFQLPVVVIHYQGFDREPDPVVYLAGGPGYSARLDKASIENYWLNWFKSKSGLKRDLVLFDQRGSGLSKPDFHCEVFQTLNTQALMQPVPPDEQAQRYRTANQQCHDELVRKGVPLATLNTQTSAQDVGDLMQLLGYQQWNLLGVSYGSRLALEVQRLFPDHVRSLSLDSVYPPGEHLMREWPDLLQASLQRLFGYCANNSQCIIENGDVRQRYQQLVAQLRRQPLLIPIIGSTVRELNSIQMNDETLLALLFDAQYVSRSLGSLASFLRHLQEGRVEAPVVQRHVKNYLFHQFDPAFHEAAFWSVECRDNPPLTPHEIAQKLQQLPDLRYYLPDAYNVCDIWHGDAQQAVLPVAQGRFQTPALILSGADDPITPLQWAEGLASQHFADNKAYLFRFNNIAHGVLDSKACADELLVSFVNTPAQRPQADCRMDGADMRMVQQAF